MAMGSASANRTQLEISCGAAAQAQFDPAFYSLHNMDYVRARAGFNAGIAAHADCAIMYWGVAMTYFQPLWPGQPTKEAIASGVEAVAKGRAAKQGTPAERAYLTAVAAFYDDAPDYATRLKHWAAGQQDLADHAPDDLEAQVFSALSRLATVDKKDKTYAEQTAVAEILVKLLKQHPDHPGLMHYLLHAYDNPLHAKEGLEIARRYAIASPDAAHALHMPSHINVRLGNWKEVIESNVASAKAARAHPGDGGKISRDLLHATDYLVYGYLQLGDDVRAGEAAKVVDPATAFEQNSGPGAYGLAATPARFALERRKWDEAAALVVKQVPYDWDHFPWAEAVTHAARGLGAARLHDAKTATAELAELDRLKPLVEATWWQGRIQIERDVIAAWLEHDPKDALAAFEKALAESPRRLNAIYGAGHAAELAGQPDVAKRFFTQLVEMTDSSSQRPSRAYAVDFLSKHH
jgi:hypothetical protein